MGVSLGLKIKQIPHRSEFSSHIYCIGRVDMAMPCYYPEKRRQWELILLFVINRGGSNELGWRRWRCVCGLFAIIILKVLLGFILSRWCGMMNMHKLITSNCEGVKLQYEIGLHGNSLLLFDCCWYWKEILINWDCQFGLKYRRADYDGSELDMILDRSFLALPCCDEDSMSLKLMYSWILWQWQLVFSSFPI